MIGHIVSTEGIQVDKAKIDQNSCQPVSKSIKVIRSFLAYTSSVGTLFKTSAPFPIPLCQLLVKEALFDWSKECQASFKNLKTLLTTTSILEAPD